MYGINNPFRDDVIDSLPLTSIMAKRGKKRNFSDTEIEVLVEEVEVNKNILFGTLNAGVTNKRKTSAWDKVTTAVNAVGSEERTQSEVKKKWFDIKIKAKKNVTAHRQQITATGGGQTTTELTPMDTRIASIIGDTALNGIIPDGDTDSLPTAVPSTSHTEGKIKSWTEMFHKHLLDSLLSEFELKLT